MKLRERNLYLSVFGFMGFKVLLDLFDLGTKYSEVLFLILGFTFICLRLESSLVKNRNYLVFLGSTIFQVLSFPGISYS